MNRQIQLWWIFLLPLTALWALVPGCSNWFVMILISLSILAILKSVVLIEYSRTSRRTLSFKEILLWNLAWPGLNAHEFWETASTKGINVRPAEWISAMGKTLLGILIVAWLVPRTVAYHPRAGGWVAMVGIVLIAHFGAFHLLALIWRCLGREVRPIMDRPLLATSVGDFWSRRWNLAFRDFANRFVMRPLAVYGTAALR